MSKFFFPERKSIIGNNAVKIVTITTKYLHTE